MRPTPASARDTVAIRFGFEIGDDGNWNEQFSGRPEYVRKFTEGSLKNLGTDYLRRLDLNTPIEETVGAMSRLIEEGKVRYLGLSVVPADILRHAHVHPISALETEYSLSDCGVKENGMLAATRKLGIGFRGLRLARPGLFVRQNQKPQRFCDRRLAPRNSLLTWF